MIFPQTSKSFFFEGWMSGPVKLSSHSVLHRYLLWWKQKHTHKRIGKRKRRLTFWGETVLFHQRQYLWYLNIWLVMPETCFSGCQKFVSCFHCIYALLTGIALLPDSRGSNFGEFCYFHVKLLLVLSFFSLYFLMQNPMKVFLWRMLLHNMDVFAVLVEA